MKIGLLFDYKGSKDLSKPELGNPGIGGTQYNFVTLSYYYNKYHKDVQWFFFCNQEVQIPNFITQIQIQDESDIAANLNSQRIDIFIWRPVDHESIVHQLSLSNTKGIAWMNNVPSPKTLSQLAQSTNTKQIVLAGHEALDLVRDHPIILKSRVIFNGFDPSPYQMDFEKKDPNLVVYLGSLTYAKGFHLLAKMWPNILRMNPNARLLVIGSGKLYHEDQKLGSYGLAEASYEDSFISYLLDENSKIHPSVNFLGLLGREMISYLKQASVGIINPHGRSEVCPGSAIEFSACGTPVVAGARYGNLDVIEHKVSGYTEKKISRQIKRIINLMRNPSEVERMGQAGKELIRQKFNQEKIMGQWAQLFQEIQGDKMDKSVYPMKKNYLYNFKIIFELLRLIKFKLGVFPKLPSIYELTQRKKFK